MFDLLGKLALALLAIALIDTIGQAAGLPQSTMEKRLPQSTVAANANVCACGCYNGRCSCENCQCVGCPCEAGPAGNTLSWQWDDPTQSWWAWDPSWKGWWKQPGPLAPGRTPGKRVVSGIQAGQGECVNGNWRVR